MSEPQGKAEFHYNPEANYDEDTIQQTQDIEKEIAKEQPFISDIQDFSALEEEYKNDVIYLGKVKELKAKYSKLRRTRGDGNCFYRAFGFAYLELLLQKEEECQKFAEAMEHIKKSLLDDVFPRFTLDEFHESFMKVLKRVEKDATSKDLLDIFNDKEESDYIVVYLRLLVSGYLQHHEDFYSNFIEGGRTVKEFCSQDVEPMDRESDHIQITALTCAVKVPIRVEYMDRADHTVTTHDFTVEDNKAKPVIHLIYRPGHYDILYH